MNEPLTTPVPEVVPAGPKIFRLPVSANGRTLQANIEANDESEAQEILRTQTQNFAARIPLDQQGEIYDLKSPEGLTRGRAFTSDEATARAATQAELKQRDSILAFEANQQEIDASLSEQWAQSEQAQFDRDNDELDKEAQELGLIPKVEAGMKAVGAVAADVASGLVQTFPQVVSGLTEGVNEIADSLQEAGTALADTLPIPNPYVMVKGVGDGVAGNAEITAGIAMGNYSERAKAFGIDPNASPVELSVLADKPDSITGNIIRSVAQFGAGLGLAGKALKGWQVVSRGGLITKALAAGAIADFTAFDQADARLSDLIEQVPGLRNPITQYLAGDEDDSALEGRLKNMIEGGTLGVALEMVPVIARAMKSYKAMKDVQPAVISEAQNAVAAGAKVEADQVAALRASEALLGDTAPDAPLVTRAKTKPRPKPTSGLEGDQLEADALTRTADALTFTPQRPQDPAQAMRDGDTAPEFGDNPFDINFNAIKAPDDVKSIIAQMIDVDSEAIDAARRRRISWQQTRMQAGKLVKDDDAFDELMNRSRGQAMNDRETQALRMVWASSATKLREIAAIAAQTGNPADLFAMRKMQTVHGSITEQVMGARTEAGRALQAWKIPAGSNEAIASRLNELVVNNDMLGSNMALAKMIAGMDDAALSSLAAKSNMMTNPQRIRTIIQASLLTNPSSHVANITGNGLTMLFETALRSLGPKMRAGDPTAVKEGESVAMFAGMSKAFAETMALGTETISNGLARRMGKDPKDLTDPATRARAYFESIAGSQTKAEGVDTNQLFPVASQSRIAPVRYAANAINAMVQATGGALSAVDQVFKYVGTSASLNASAFRQVQNEIEAGILDQSNAVARQRELFESPTADMLDEAHRFAEEATFNRPQEYWEDEAGIKRPGLGRSLLNIRGAIEGGRGLSGVAGGFASGVVMPFINTTSNILSYTFRSSPFAPLMRRYQEDIAAGGAREEIARARMTAGSMIMWSAMGLAANGNTSGGGPMDTQQRQLLQRQGWQPYSIKVGDRWFAYNRLDPLGALLSIGSDAVDMSMNTDWGDQDSVDQWTEWVATAMGAVSNTFMNKSMLSGVGDMFEYMGDPMRYGENFLLQRLSAPVPAIVGVGERIIDPYQRDGMVTPREAGPINDFVSGMESFTQLFKAKTPGLSDLLPARRDLWGRPMLQASGLGPWYEALSPSRSSQEKVEPIDVELERLGYYPAMPQKRITLPQDMRAGPADDGSHLLSDRPDIYNRIVEISGALALAQLNDLVAGVGIDGDNYKNSTEDDQKKIIAEVLKDARAVAKEQVIDEFQYDFMDMVDRRRAGYDVPMPVSQD